MSYKGDEKLETFSSLLGIVAWALIATTLIVAYYAFVFAVLWNHFVIVQCGWLQRVNVSQSLAVGLTAYVITATLTNIAMKCKSVITLPSAPAEKEHVLWKPTNV